MRRAAVPSTSPNSAALSRYPDELCIALRRYAGYGSHRLFASKASRGHPSHPETQRFCSNHHRRLGLRARVFRPGAVHRLLSLGLRRSALRNSPLCDCRLGFRHTLIHSTQCKNCIPRKRNWHKLRIGMSENGSIFQLGRGPTSAERQCCSLMLANGLRRLSSRPSM